MGVRNARMDFLDALYRQDVTGRRAGELVGAVAGTDGDRQRIDTWCPSTKWRLLPDRSAAGRCDSTPSAPEPSSSPAMPVSSEPRQPSSPSTDTPQACAMATVRRVTSALYSIAHRRLHVFTQRAVHHHRAETELDGTLANGRRCAVVLVHDDGMCGHCSDAAWIR